MQHLPKPKFQSKRDCHTLKGVIWIVASRSEPFSKIRHAHWGFPVENLDSKKPPRRLALEDYVSLFS